ncbi:MAG TPA: DUF1631 family protein, partial [Usitatibacter sp.]|nr:DUF1631 family protein [Usitatibacter sp.]
MAQSPLGNVVPLGDHPRARARPSRKESADMLTGCRELAGRRMATALSGMLDRIEDDLFDLAEKAVDREAQNLYLDARAQAREKRTQIEATFGLHFVEFFNRKVRGEVEAEKPGGEPGELSLVGDQDLEERLAVREMSRKLQSACEGELNALSARVGFLLEKPELADEANPLSPWAVCSALKDACDQIQADYKVRMTLLRQFEHYAQEALQLVYHELNSHLVELRVLPDVRPGLRRSPSAPAKPRKAAEKAAPGSASAPSAPSVPGAPAADGDILGALAQLLQGRPPQPSGSPGQSFGAQARGGVAQSGPGGGAPASGGAAALWPTAGGNAAPTVPASFVSELTRLHREPGEALAGSEEALMNVVRRIKAAPQSASLGTIDAMTIDIVAMLFDYIFDDRHIPAAVKALIGRLQIPTLKVALMDKSFF